MPNVLFFHHGHQPHYKSLNLQQVASLEMWGRWRWCPSSGSGGTWLPQQDAVRHGQRLAEYSHRVAWKVAWTVTTFPPIWIPGVFIFKNSIIWIPTWCVSCGGIPKKIQKAQVFERLFQLGRKARILRGVTPSWRARSLRWEMLVEC